MFKKKKSENIVQSQPIQTTQKVPETGIIDKGSKTIKDLIAPYQYDTTGYHVLFIAKDQTG